MHTKEQINKLFDEIEDICGECPRPADLEGTGGECERCMVRKLWEQLFDEDNWWDFADGDNAKFYTADSALKSLNGLPCTIVRKLDRSEADLNETGPMYVVKFPNGTEVQAFEDELNGCLNGLPTNC